ncbi:hypothetical protein [Nonomuraea wenchangensis]|uniref:hypothetical protein n=1 Tax=Nonomuraea wenchangensis TaxID=568860 RepID=UPI003324BD07
MSRNPLAHHPHRAGAAEIATAMFTAPPFAVLIVPVLLTTVVGPLTLAVALCGRGRRRGGRQCSL